MSNIVQVNTSLFTAEIFTSEGIDAISLDVTKAK